MPIYKKFARGLVLKGNSQCLEPHGAKAMARTVLEPLAINFRGSPGEMQRH